MSREEQICCPTCNEVRVTKSHNKKDKRCKQCYSASQRLAPNANSTYKVLIASVKSGAKKRGIAYELSFDQFKDIVQDNCFWCGEKPASKNPKGERMPTIPAPANGIDRIDNSIGYIYTNCVASCQVCNVAKNNHTEQEFLAWIEKIYKFKFLGIEGEVDGN
jgi:hypothetical protein